MLTKGSPERSVGSTLPTIGFCSTCPPIRGVTSERTNAHPPSTPRRGPSSPLPVVPPVASKEHAGGASTGVCSWDTGGLQHPPPPWRGCSSNSACPCRCPQEPPIFAPPRNQRAVANRGLVLDPLQEDALWAAAAHDASRRLNDIHHPEPVLIEPPPLSEPPLFSQWDRALNSSDAISSLLTSSPTAARIQHGFHHSNDRWKEPSRRGDIGKESAGALPNLVAATFAGSMESVPDRNIKPDECFFGPRSCASKSSTPAGGSVAEPAPEPLDGVTPPTTAQAAERSHSCWSVAAEGGSQLPAEAPLLHPLHVTAGGLPWIYAPDVSDDAAATDPGVLHQDTVVGLCPGCGIHDEGPASLADRVPDVLPRRKGLAGRTEALEPVAPCLSRPALRAETGTLV
mmetsp:Transcript_65774/g.122646  ORF Transcript_65774/g.122646 Transcript_65774/m.122646 type:complete len:399 (-) Transcript_65774:24-1220(-)